MTAAEGDHGTGAPLADRVVDAALELAEEVGWGDVRLHLVAARLEVTLAAIAEHYADLDAVANAWFARARAAMLAGGDPALDGRPPPERLHAAIMRWFEALGAHREVTGEILREKLYASHPHHWVPLVFDLSRLIHWFLDAAAIRSIGRQRQLAEIGLTLIFLRTLGVWLGDQTPGQLRTRATLRRALERADGMLTRRRPTRAG